MNKRLCIVYTINQIPKLSIFASLSLWIHSTLNAWLHAETSSTLSPSTNSPRQIGQFWWLILHQHKKAHYGSFGKGGRGTSCMLACSSYAVWHFFQQKWKIPSKRMTTAIAPTIPRVLMPHLLPLWPKGVSCNSLAWRRQQSQKRENATPIAMSAENVNERERERVQMIIFKKKKERERERERERKRHLIGNHDHFW